MTTTPTERRLAITPGPYTHKGPAVLKDGKHYSLQNSEHEALSYADRANRYLLVEDVKKQALEVYQACGLTPSELLAKVEGLRMALVKASDTLRQGGMESYTDDADEIDALLSTLNLPQ